MSTTTDRPASLRVLIIVSPDASDQFFANRLAQRLNVVGVVVESQQSPRDRTPRWKKALRLLVRPRELYERATDLIARQWRRRFARHARPEYAPDFGELGERLHVPEKLPVLRTSGRNRINEPEYVDWIRERRPDVIAVCGASILREGILSVPPRGVLNLHGGLSQRYRGLFTTDWAIYNREPEWVGCTVHYVAPGIDDGDIVYQGRPELTSDDHPNSAYAKVVRLGVDMMERAIRDIEAGTGRRTRLTESGALYLHRDFTPQAKAATWRRCRAAMADYLAHRLDRDAAVRRAMINEFERSGEQAES